MPAAKSSQTHAARDEASSERPRNSRSMCDQRVRLAKNDLPGRPTRGFGGACVPPIPDVGRFNFGNLRERVKAPLAARGLPNFGLFRVRPWYRDTVESASPRARNFDALAALAAMRFCWGCSSIGRAPEWHSGGRRFDPDQLHQHHHDEATHQSLRR